VVGTLPQVSENVELSVAISRLTLDFVMNDVFQSAEENANVTCDELAKYEIISWLLQQGLTDRLLALPQNNQSLLEDYMKKRLDTLSSREENLLECISLRLMLWRLFTKRNAHFEAAQMLESLALSCQHNSEPTMRTLSLDNRIEYLARAIVSLKSLESQQRHSHSQYLKAVQDRLDTAELQQQLLQELLTSGSGVDIDSAAQKLSFGPLYDLTTLFMQFAEPLNMYEAKLHIFRAANHQDCELIRAVWTDLLKRHLTYQPEQHGDVPASSELALAECLRRQYQHIIQANKAYHSELNSTDSLYFPGELIVAQLEQYAIERNLDTSWVLALFRRADIYAPSQLARHYDALLRSKDPFWHSDKRRERLFSVLLAIFRQFLNDCGSQPQRSRQYHATKLMDLNSTMMVELQSGSGASSPLDPAKAKAILSQFAQFQQQLEQIFM
ncbi:hypothetical protein Ciccas_006224, partial [Cichlidogyrus casuarinus]